MSYLNKRVGFIGFGKMASAMANGFIKSGILQPGDLHASARHESSLSSLKELGGFVTLSNSEVVERSEIVFLAVKPLAISSVLQEIANKVTKNHVIVSMALGISIDSMENLLPAGVAVIRIMPNTPCLVLHGACVLTRGHAVNDNHVNPIIQLLTSTGLCEEVPTEELLDAVGGLSGCGPAYMYTILESMADGAVKVGVPRETATRMAAHVMIGAANMVLQTNKHPGQLKDEVCSPGGATICGIHTMERLGARNAIISAIEAGSLKAKEVRDANK